MVKKIGKSIFLVSLLVLVSSIFIIMSFLYSYYSNSQHNAQKIQLSLISKGVENMGITYLDNINLKDYRVTYIDTDGTVLYDNTADKNTMENHSHRAEVIKAEETGYGESKRYSKTMKEKTIYCAKRLSDGTVIRVAITNITIFSLILGILYPIIIVIIIAIILSVIFSATLSKRIVKPLDNLDLEHPLDNEAYDELSPLLLKLDKQNKKIKKQINSLNRKNNEINYITKNISEGIIILNNDGYVLSANIKAVQIFGCKENDFYLDFYRNLDYKQVVADALSGKSSSVKVVIDSLTYKIAASTISLSDNEHAVFMFISDISEEEQASKMRREFSANVSHELKTPLTSIIGSAEIIENGIAKPQDIPHFAGKIHQEAKRLLDLIQDIIKISRLDENELNAEFTDINLCQVCQLVYTNLKEKTESKGIIFNTDLENISIKGFSPVIYEIIFNLCDNAINYNKPDGRVTLTTKLINSHPTVIVEDTGIGIAKEDQNHIFERFYRVDKSHSKETGGTGLGLSIVKHGCRLHKADININSELNKGTTITITF